MNDVSLVKLPSDECNWILLMICQHWFRWWLDAGRQQAITWANVDRDLCRHVASLVKIDHPIDHHITWLEPTKRNIKYQMISVICCGPAKTLILCDAIPSLIIKYCYLIYREWPHPPPRQHGMKWPQACWESIERAVTQFKLDSRPQVVFDVSYSTGSLPSLS